MTDGWLNPAKYEHIPITGCTGPGTMVGGYNWKWVNHTTESPPGTINGVISLFKSAPCSTPHFCIDPMGTQRRVQFIPWTWSAAALRGGNNGWQTNRGCAVQVEIVGYAREAGDFTDDALWQIADTIADVIVDGLDINPQNTPDSTLLRGTLATMDAPQRLSWEAWRDHDGILAHVYVPNNDHWDAGNIDSHKIAAYVDQILAGTGRTIVPRPAGGPLPPAPDHVLVGYLQKGMTGGIVKFVQDLLLGLGYNVGVGDGVFGFQTEQAVKQFQRDKGLSPDGVVGPDTNAAISAAYQPLTDRPAIPTPPSPAEGLPAWPGRFLLLTDPLMSGGDVRTWQKQMAARGWAIGVDGVFGLETLSIVKTFQEEKNLQPVDGVVGRLTWNAAWTAPVS